MRIFVPTDFSEPAERAFEYAVRIAPRGSELILYHAFIPFESGFYSLEKSKAENNATAAQFRSQLRVMASSAAGLNPHIRISVQVGRGASETAILKFVARKHIDLIVMGTTGASGLKEKLIGSLTSAVMTLADRPVIAVPANYIFQPVNHIEFASDHMLEELEALKLVSRLARAHKARVQITHFEDKAQDKDRSAAHSANYRKIVSAILPGERFRFQSQRVTHVGDALKRLSREKEIDLLVLVTHPRKGLFNKLLDKSLTRQVAAYARVPVLSVPAAASGISRLKFE